MMKGGLGNLMKQAQQMQTNLQKVQEELLAIEVTGQAGGNMVSVVMTDAVSDLSGNTLTPFVSTFTTGVIDNDNNRPSVTRQLPANGSNGWTGVREIILYTNEPMNTASIERAFHVAQNGVLINGTLEVLDQGQTIRFTKAEPFAAGALVQVYLESTATDDSGNAVYDYSGYFNTLSSSALVGTSPYPTAYYPGNSMTGLPLNPAILVSYSEALDAASVTSTNVQLQDVSGGFANVASTVSLERNGLQLRVVPTAPLMANKEYYLRLSDTITDSDGDEQGWIYGTYFTTAADAVVDDRQPVVLAVSPPVGEKGVGVNAHYAVRFDERMNPLSFDPADGKRFGAQFSEDNRVVHYDRLGTLSPNTEVTEPVPAMIDVSGNVVVAATTVFTTGSGPDFVRPTVVKTSIANGQRDVATNPVLEWVFSEPIDPVSVTSSGVYLLDNTDGNKVPTTASLSSDGKRLMMVPNAVLAPGRNYYGNAANLLDLSGNSLDAARSFTTGFGEDVTAPVVQRASVGEGQTEVPINVRLNVQYDEPLNAVKLSGVALTDAGGTRVPANVTLSGDRRTLGVVSTQLLEPAAMYTLTVNGVAMRRASKKKAYSSPRLEAHQALR